jgi:hypothetical protein
LTCLKMIHSKLARRCIGTSLLTVGHAKK